MMTLLIVGASARAAAESARRADIKPFAADLFADVDLQSIAPTQRITDYARELPELVRRSPAEAWMYTGGLENHPQLVKHLARVKPLWGIQDASLRAVRDPWQVAAALTAAGIATPRLARHQLELVCRPSESLDGPWMEKPLRSCGGRDVRRIEYRTSDPPASAGEGPPEASDAARAVYWQAAIDGLPCSGAFVAAAGKAMLLGVTRQLIGAPWLAAHGFQYCGSVGPLLLDDGCRATLLRIGDCLAAKFQLVGLFGVDFILTETGVVPIEVNPRYTASMELLERATGIRVIEHHRRACCDGRLKQLDPSSTSRCWGKAIVFADEEMVIRTDLRRQTKQLATNLLTVARRASEGAKFFYVADLCVETRGRVLIGEPGRESEQAAYPEIADVPAVGSTIASGHPIATVFASGADLTSVMLQLNQQAQALRAM